MTLRVGLVQLEFYLHSPAFVLKEAGGRVEIPSTLTHTLLTSERVCRDPLRDMRSLRDWLGRV